MQPPITTEPGSADETPDHEVSALEEAVRRMSTRTPEQKLADRELMKKSIRKGRPLPEGKTIMDVLCGQWPGDEPDEVIFEYLKRLS